MLKIGVVERILLLSPVLYAACLLVVVPWPMPGLVERILLLKLGLSGNNSLPVVPMLISSVLLNVLFCCYLSFRCVWNLFSMEHNPLWEDLDGDLVFFGGCSGVISLP
jgi:hypothetical protein